jgi:hypothetical protein
MNLIPVKKASVSTITVLSSFIVTILSLFITKKCGIVLDEGTQITLTLVITSILSGIVTGGMNYLKHLPKPPIVEKPIKSV